MCVNGHQQELLDVPETHCMSQQLNSELRTSTLRLGGVILECANIHTTCNTYTAYLTLKKKKDIACIDAYIIATPSFPFQSSGFHFHHFVTGLFKHASESPSEGAMCRAL